MSSNVILMCGIIGAGKSTWAKELVKSSDYKTVIINRDAIREMFCGEYKYIDELEGIVRKTAEATLKECIDSGVDIIIDETNITKAIRKRWLDLIYNISKETDVICVYCHEKEKNVERRMQNPKGQSRDVWEKVYKNMFESFEEPDISEGFNVVMTVS